MFGYVTIYRKGLADADMDRYQAYYCGLCRALGRRYGRTGQLALSYDMAFVAILLTALYDVPTAYTAGRCAPHPIKPRPRADNEFMDYAADMTAALAYYNFMDDWQDDHRRASLAQAQKLEPQLPALRERWPRQMQTMTDALDKLNALESAGSHDLDALCNAFGALLGDVFACRDDIWAPALRAMGQGLGGFIYLMDAYDDLEKDEKKGRFNALRQLADELPPAAYEQRCHELLTQQMGRCAQPFEMIHTAYWASLPVPMMKRLKKPTAKSASNTTPTCTPTILPPRSTLRKCRPHTARSCASSRAAARRTGKAANPTARAGTASSTRTPSAGAGSALGRSGSGTTAQAVQPGGRATAAPQATPSCVRRQTTSAAASMRKP